MSTTVNTATGAVEQRGGVASAVAGGEATIRNSEGAQVSTQGGASVEGEGKDIDLSQPGNDSATTDTTQGDTQGGSTEGGQDSLEGGSGNDSLPNGETEAQLIARMNEAGGIYADPNYQPFAVLFERQGDLTPEQRAEAATKFGVTQAFVDTFIDNQKQLRELAPVAADQAAAPFYAIVGGKDEWPKFQAWAEGPDGLPEADREAYTKAIQSSPKAAEALLEKYTAKWKIATGDPVDATDGGVNVPNGQTVQGFASSAEQTAAINDPRYTRDSAYRKGVEAKIGASNFTK